MEILTIVVTDLKRYIDCGFRKAKLPQGLWHEKEAAVKLDPPPVCQKLAFRFIAVHLYLRFPSKSYFLFFITRFIINF